ncbi:MAG: 1,4-dihydroxy-6-naphthoate synthase [Spirochaetia bacterium]|nr:1,4-dihydroxy-6-naphthoate synthase [Spirochaetia bacterium]
MISLSAAISPCPNDTFSFYFAAHERKFDINLEISFCDIQELNEGAAAKKWDIVKASFMAASKLRADYDLLPSGSAIGPGVGPVMLSKNESIEKDFLRVGIPGKDTTAHFLFEYFRKTRLSSKEIEKRFMIFSDIMKNLENDQIDIGVVIHEGRFVYKSRNFFLVEDLGAFWEVEKDLPIPLGGIFIKKEIDESVKDKVSQILRQSVGRALEEKKMNTGVYQKDIFNFMKRHAQELDKETIEKHIETYVNEDTVSLSKKSREAIEEFYREVEAMNL